MASVRVAVRDEVLGRLPDLSAELVATIAEHVPAYAALSGPQLAEVSRIAAWGTTRVLQLWVEGGELTPADVQRFKGIGAARALDGRPLPGVLRAYRVAGTHITELVEQLGGDRLTVADAMALSRLWMASIDTLSEALYAGHAAAAERVTGDRARALGDLVDDLLVGRQVTRTGLADRGRELGIVLGPRTDLLLLSATEPITVDQLAAFLAEVGAPPLARVRDGGAVALLPAEPGWDTAEVGRRGWRGCLLGGLAVPDLPRAARLGEHLLAHAPERAFADRAVLEEADAQVVALVAGHVDADAERLAALVLGGLRGDGPDHLADGLAAYLAAGSATEAAARLGLHAQTMRYRLRRLREVTGRDPRRPWDRLVLEAASLAAGRAGPGRPGY